MFKSAERSLTVSHSTRKAGILKLPLLTNSSIKASLASLFNETLGKLWNKSSLQKHIILGDGFFHKKDVTSAVLKLSRDVLRKEEEEWTMVGSRNSQMTPDI